MTVPNAFPTRPTPRRLAIIADAPVPADASHHVCPTCSYSMAAPFFCARCKQPAVPRPSPFVSPYGQLLNVFLANAGIDRATCFLGHVSQHPTPAGDLTRLKWDGPEVVAGLKALADDLRRFQPHFVLCLGNGALRAFCGEKRSTEDWRGSLLLTAPDSPFPGVKMTSTYGPVRVQKQYDLTAVVRFDLRRVVEELRTDELVVPADHIVVDDSFEGLLAVLGDMRRSKQRVAVDLEGYVDYVSCIGFAWAHNEAFVVPFMRADGTSWWTEEEEVRLWQAVADVLQDPDVPKVLQNSLYDCFVLAWSYGIVIEGIVDDTMLKHFELYAELEKSLGFQTSIYTKHPFYKFQRKSDDERVQLEYCGRDCCRTLECCDAQEAMLKPQQREHYRFNLSLLAPLLYMELRGIRYDKPAAEARLAETQQQIYELQDAINQEAARSDVKPELRQFYSALGVSIHSGTSGTGESLSVVPHTDGNLVGVDTERTSMARGIATLLPLLTSAFCCCERDRREKREVEEVTWQPMRWNGKRWVKAGKRLTSDGATDLATQKSMHWSEEVPADPTWELWLKPIRKLVTCHFPVAITTLEDVRRFALGSKQSECKAACALASQVAQGAGLTPAQRGELATLLGIHVKVNATGEGGDAQWYLYTWCALPKQFQKEGNTLTTRLATDDEALIKAYLKSGKDDATRDQRAMRFLDMRRLVTQTKFLKAEPDADGRIRSGMNLVATPTCRMAMYGSPTGTSDLNLQTIGKGLRDLFIADEGCYIGQRDLSNADAYSVAAFCAMLGDSAMLDDLRAKIKPANVLARIYESGPAINRLTRDELREECKKVDGEGWLYFACKRVLHGTNYGMGKQTMANQILTDSFKLLGKPIWLEPKACEAIQEKAFFVRYPGVRRWHEWMKRELTTKGVLLASTGFQRRIFGRKEDHNTLKESLAHYPQYFTTLAIKSTLISPKGLPRQWTDPENRRPDGSLRVEPLLLVHDSNVSQWRQEDTDFAKRKMAEWFQNEIAVANLTLVIPASGTYGRNWKAQNETL